MSIIVTPSLICGGYRTLIAAGIVAVVLLHACELFGCSRVVYGYLVAFLSNPGVIRCRHGPYLVGHDGGVCRVCVKYPL